MSLKFIIDNRFQFTTDDSKIEDITNGNITTLITPAARCLATLLQNRRLVTHQELYSSGWGETSKDPAPSSLYQNILLIRKAFKELSGSDIDYITTVPRKGFIFKQDATVSQSENISTSLTLPDIENKIISAPSALRQRITFIQRTYLHSSRVVTCINYILIISCALLVISILVRIPHSSSVNILSESFMPYQEVNGCKYYLEKKTPVALLNNASSNTLIKQLWDAARDENGISCANYPWRYIVLFEHENRARILACTRPGDDDQEQVCVTIFKRND